MPCFPSKSNAWNQGSIFLVSTQGGLLIAWNSERDPYVNICNIGIWRCHHCIEKRWKLLVRTPLFGITACDMKGGRCGFSNNCLCSHLHMSNSLLDETTTKRTSWSSTQFKTMWSCHHTTEPFKSWWFYSCSPLHSFLWIFFLHKKRTPRTDLLDSDSGPSCTSHGRLSPHAPGVLNDKNAIRMHQTCPEFPGGEAWKELQ